jgi:hypothetical protein
MSEVSVLSHEYKNAAEFSQRFNRALIQVKKCSLDLIEDDSPAQEGSIASRKELASVLEEFIHLLNPQQGQRTDSAKWIPGTLIAHLLKQRRGDLDNFLDDLERLAAKLRDPGASLSQEDFNLLDGIAAAADAQTSQVFRRLMRK